MSGIIIIGDNLEQSKTYADILTKHEFKITSYDIHKPPGNARTMQPKLVLLHITMLPGPTLKTYFRNFDIKETTLIVLANHSLATDAEFAYKRGVDHYILKPRLLESHLLHIVNKSIHRH